MQNHKKQDKISVNEISPRNVIKNVSNGAVGNAEEEPFCVYAHKRHAVGSKIINDDGSKSECKDNSSWKQH